MANSPSVLPAEAAPQRMESHRLLGAGRGELASRVFWDGWRGLGLALAGFGLVGLIGLFDYLTGPQVSFTVFYLIPIALGAWWGGFAQGILLSMACALSWQLVEIAEGSRAAPIIQVWNGIARFGIFVFTSSMLARLRLSLFLEKKLARSDPLTGAANGRTFYESVSLTVEHALRADKPMTLAYLDLDQFKWINDNLGHAAGDEVLCELVQITQRNIRAIDLLARLGGDEFAVMLAECGDEDARTTLERIRELFAEEMRNRRLPVTLSVGAVTFPQPSRDVDAMVRQVDELMYRAKRTGKNRIVHETHEIEPGDRMVQRRAAARILCDRMARVRAKDEPEFLDEFARVRDISTNGACLFLERRLPVDTLLAVEPLHECGAVTLVARVLWAVEENGGWLHGCILPNRLSNDELNRWIQEQTAESCCD